MDYLQQHGWFWVLVLSAVALSLVVLKIWRTRSKKTALEKDKHGFWKYHKNTHYTLKRAYGAQLEEKKSPAKKSSEETAVAVIKFTGDLRAKQHTAFAKLVDEVVLNRKRVSEIVVIVDSPGGLVPHYGHVYSEMERLRALEIPLTVCVDVIAASGGYLMSLPATRILAAPFAMIGSIGVVAFVPNIRGLLTRWDIDPRTFTAGQYKRTVNLTDQATPEEVAHFQGQLESIHRMFSQAVGKYRAAVNVDQVATGDHWTAAESVALGLGLIDELCTSSDYLLRRNRECNLLFLSGKRSLWEEKLSRLGVSAADHAESRLARLFAPSN